MKRLNNALNSPLLLFVLVAAFAALGARWYRADAAQHAPTLPGYDWGKHPRALLIVVPKAACGCGGPPTDSVKMALAKYMDVVVLASAPNEQTKAIIAAHLSAQHLKVLNHVSDATIKRFAPATKTAFINVHYGRMTYQSGDGLAPDLFKIV